MVSLRYLFEDDDMDCIDFFDYFDMEDFDMEWLMLDQESEDEGIILKIYNDMDGDIKFIVYKSSLEYFLLIYCLYCGILINKVDYEWSVLGVCVCLYIKLIMMK